MLSQKLSGKRPSLVIRITAAFAVFGLLIGYCSYLFYTMIATREFIELYRALVLRRLYHVTASEDGDMFMRIIGMDTRDVRSFGNQIRHISMKSHTIREIHAYIYKTDEGKWYRVSVSRDDLFAADPAEPEIVRELEQARDVRIQVAPFFFWGRADHLHVKIDITRPVDRNRYYLHLVVDRRGILQAVHGNIRVIAAFGAVLLVCSTLLGYLVTRRLLKPLRELSKLSRSIASGNYGRKLDLNTDAELVGVAKSLNMLSEHIQSDFSVIRQKMLAMETMNMIDKAVLASTSRGDLLDRVIGIVSRLLHCHYIALVIRREDRRGFELLSYLEREHLLLLNERPFISDSTLDSFMRQSYREYFNLTRKRGVDLDDFFGRLVGDGIGAIINAPLYIYGNYLGSLILGRSEGETFSPDEEEIVKLLADQVAVALNSVKMLEEREEMMLGIMIALSRSIDAKSKWTAGHSERVARYCETMGIRLGFREDELRQLRIAAILHDIGKIAVPETILDKTGPLADDEWDIIRTHPEIGGNIIGNIPAFRDIVPAICHHHEHWDGSGYPIGLKGEEIPRNARIITLADVYDAITDDRPYRKGMDQQSAVAFMRVQSGLLFDPRLLDLFLESCVAG